MAKHSSVVGGSTAARLLNCPGSFQRTQALPPSADTPSEYAEEGTAMHAVMDALMRHRMSVGVVSSDMAERWIGQTFHDRVLTQEHVDSMIMPALDALHDLEDYYGDGFRVAAVEMQVKFPGVPGAFGTCDLVLVSDSHAIVLDWKFGQGVPVLALYSDGDSDLLNAQLMFYISAAMATKHRLFVRRKLVIAIVQPRTGEPLTHTDVTRKDITIFREDMELAVAAAIDRDPPLRKGEHCRWCPAKVACPLWTGPILGLEAAIGRKVAKPAPVDIEQAPTPYGEYLSRAKSLVDVLAMYSKEVNDQLHTYLEAGGIVPGWRLKAKVKQRQWIDQDVVIQELCNLGFDLDDICTTKLKTFQQTDAVARKLGVKIPEHLRVAPDSVETTVCPTNDPAPVVDRHLAHRDFMLALSKLT